MKSSRVGMVMSVLALLLLEWGRSTDARLLENDLFFGAGNPSAFDPGLNAAVGEAGMSAIPDPKDKTGLPCDEGGVLSPQNATNRTKMLTFRFKEDRRGGDGKGAEEVVYNELPKGRATPSGPNPKGNAAVNAERLAKSGHSPEVGHMQVFNTAKSRQSDGAGQLQDGSEKRILQSTPSPGGGH